MNPQTKNPPELTRSTNVHFTSAEKKLMDTTFNSRLKAVEKIQKAYRKFQTQILKEIIKLKSTNNSTKCCFCTTNPEPDNTGLQQKFSNS